MRDRPQRNHTGRFGYRQRSGLRNDLMSPASVTERPPFILKRLNRMSREGLIDHIPTPEKTTMSERTIGTIENLV